LPPVIFNPFFIVYFGNLFQYGADGCVRRKDKMMAVVEAGTPLSAVWLPLSSGGPGIGRFTVVCLLAEHTLVRAKDLSFFPFACQSFSRVEI
jgi:hypothetical protein